MFQMVSAHCQMWCFLWQWLERNFNTKNVEWKWATRVRNVCKVIESLKIDYTWYVIGKSFTEMLIMKFIDCYESRYGNENRL